MRPAQLLPEEDGTWNLIMTEAFSQLCDFAEEQMDEIGVPGVALGVLHEGEMATAAFGVTNVDHPLEVTAKTLFQIGSITKTFTAMAVLRLVDMGLLELGATIRTYLPDFKVVDEAAATGATIRHLLTHTANWVGDFFIDTGAGDEALARYTAAMAQLEQLAPLDTVWSYNVASFCLAGYVIEVLTGKSYRSALQDLVLEPLGLESVYFDAGGVITHRFAVGHGVGKKGSAVLRPWGLPRAFDPTGGIITDLKTLLRYAHFHLGDGKTEDGARLLQPQLMALMHAPQVTIWGKRAMGLSWFIDDIEGVRRLSHDGATIGQLSLLTLVPDRDFAVAVFANAAQGGSLTHPVTHRALELYLDVATSQPRPIDASHEQLAAYAGRYVRPYSDVELYLEDGQLMIQVTPKQGFPNREAPPAPASPPMRVGLCGEDQLLVLDGPAKGLTGEFIRTADGTIGWFRIGGLRIGRLHKRTE